MLHRRGGLASALAVGGAGDLGEDGAEQAGVEVGEAIGAEVRDEDGVDVAGVVEPGRRADVGAGVEPVPQPPLDGPALGGPVGGGAGATYADVLDGVDLVIESTRTGYEQFFVVKTREALAKSGKLTLRLKAPKLKMSPDGGGGLLFKTKDGSDAGRIPAPSMWNATIGEQSLDHLRVGSVALSAVQHDANITLELTPDPQFLASPDLAYPITIDPSIYPTFDTFVQSGWVDDQSGLTDLKLGYSDDGGSWTARSYLRWDTAFLAGAQVNSATVCLWNYHSWSCTAAAWEVWDTRPALCCHPAATRRRRAARTTLTRMTTATATGVSRHSRNSASCTTADQRAGRIAGAGTGPLNCPLRTRSWAMSMELTSPGGSSTTSTAPPGRSASTRTCRVPNASVSSVVLAVTSSSDSYCTTTRASPCQPSARTAAPASSDSAGPSRSVPVAASTHRRTSPTRRHGSDSAVPHSRWTSATGR
ncbi:hypothetical protein [Dactylosporangium fulvum]|uniref:Uncharacterized protein n=1 Tax=Dactylosporangium fulvum TaxID=53359 RepID=A0ABY5VXE7_9ACTN|nr:hypothetical protein [Dactylosporangium fulvum]UWP82368.1 hypothetical protein Dfulv_46220 [Dactylosporangium fulvum]